MKPKPPAAIRRVPVISELALSDDRFEVVKPFKLSASGRDAIAASLGIPHLPPLMTSTLEAAISRYKAQSRLPLVTAGQNIAAIDVALSAADKFEASLRCFADLEHSGVGAKTAVPLSRPASEAITCIREFRAVAQSRKRELLTLSRRRLGAEHGPLGGLCSLIRFVFESAGHAPRKLRDREARTTLHDFALAVLEAAKIPHGDYFDHKARLDKLFSMSLQDDLLASRLRIEGEAMAPSKVRKMIP
jgi:hypothetical protein